MVPALYGAPTTAQLYYSALYEHYTYGTVCVHYFIYMHRCILYPYIQKSTWHSDAHLPHHFIPTVAFCRDICWTPPRSQRSVFVHPRPRGQGATRNEPHPCTARTYCKYASPSAIVSAFPIAPRRAKAPPRWDKKA